MERAGGGVVVASTEDCDAMMWLASRVKSREDRAAGRVETLVELPKETTLEVELVEFVELEVRIMNVCAEEFEVAEGDDAGGELGCSPKLSALTMSAAFSATAYTTDCR